MITLNKLLAIMAISALATVVSCSKTATPNPTGLLVNLQAAAISVAEIDSADVVFRKSGTDTRVRMSFVKTRSGLVAPIQFLTPGTWHADIEIYTKTVNQSSRQYVMIKPIQVTNPITHLEIPGPGISSGNGWSKRHVRTSIDRNVVLIIPDDMYDPYFEFRTKGQNRYALGIQREAINVNYIVDQKTWACANNCLDADGRFSNIDHFMSFVRNVQASPWTDNAISISVINEKSEIILEYDRTWNR